MKKIILPTDFSDNAYNAIRYAAQLFKDENTTFYLLHTYTPPIYASEFVSQSPIEYELADAYRVNSISQLKKTKNRIEKEFKNPKHSFITHSAFNTLVEEVLGTIEYEKADLVIMGTQGATGANEILFGTNTVHLIKKSTCPVIAVPTDFVYESPKEILFPTDYEIDYSNVQLKQLVMIAKSQNSLLHVLHISSGYELTNEQEGNKKRLESQLGSNNTISHDIPDQEVIEAINGFQTKKPIMLLVMVRNKHTFFERLFIEPLIKKIAFHVKIPFMVMPYISQKE
ncbi:universal stress protein [Maribacter polysiphoniae]|uniref:Nucleotide-binding universal stress UspA family protein n=1 Tax=Maribacter polysiphoniae TaxID=429344 RepID=A0A316DLF3_9FLAO|nr:universal stress protein [Maribacter polysiphoniae]MBD1263149.1 universal stress protein [Maribacter polysiphoniae]PWK18352.1 nucleotide-binding universal stress UspA family protein [Maribacter polysiphoniae]